MRNDHDWVSGQDFLRVMISGAIYRHLPNTPHISPEGAMLSLSQISTSPVMGLIKSCRHSNPDNYSLYYVVGEN